MHLVLHTSLVIPALALLLTGCTVFRIASAITARHAGVHLLENNLLQAKAALSMAYNLSALLMASDYRDGVKTIAERQELSDRLQDFMKELIVSDLILAADINDMVSVMKINHRFYLPYRKVDDIRYMVDAFIDVVERGVGNVETAPDGPSDQG